MRPASDQWWRDSVGYEIYVPSFQDSNDDGWGDLPGILSRLDYLVDLGVDLLWLSPIHPSPFADGGYDVADYLSVNPRFGHLKDVDRLIAAADDRGLRILLDLVPNHTSVAHRWFRDARTARGSRHRDYYWWRDPSPNGGPPNNWVSALGGPAWTLDESTGQYYLHLFDESQPDLNWSNAQVAAEFDTIMDFWLDRGFAGFRVDVPHVMAKHPDLPDNPRLPEEEVQGDVRGIRDWDRFEHRFDLDQPALEGIYEHWRRRVDQHGGLLLGEINIVDPTRLARHTTQERLHLAFWFGLIRREWAPDDFDELIREAAASLPDLAWVLSSHDRPRAVTRYGGGAAGRRRALVLATLTIGLSALPFLYQGDELGLEDVTIPADQVRDPAALNGTGETYTRDAARSPMPWAPRPGLGFTHASTPWLPLGERSTADTVQVQLTDPHSMLARYRTLLAVRHRCTSLRHGRVTWLETPGCVLAYRRGDCLVAANLGPETADLPLPDGSRWRLEFDTSTRHSTGALAGWLAMAPEQAVILARE
ncbi:alpha-amylase family glycosyl hydrolase [Geodermatophilus sp. SYSU D00700]